MSRDWVGEVTRLYIADRISSAATITVVAEAYDIKLRGVNWISESASLFQEDRFVMATLTSSSDLRADWHTVTQFLVGSV